MLLQHELFYDCFTLAQMIEGGRVPVLLYGVERVRQESRSWQSYFVPPMLESVRGTVKAEQSEVYDAVMNTADCIGLLATRCDEILTVCKGTANLAVRRRLHELQYVLEQIVLPEMSRLDYDDPQHAKVLRFSKTGQFLASFVPIEVTSNLDGIHGVFTGAEQTMLSYYMDVVGHAPSLANTLSENHSKGIQVEWVCYEAVAKELSVPDQRFLDVGEHKEIWHQRYSSWAREMPWG